VLYSTQKVFPVTHVPAPPRRDNVLMFVLRLILLSVIMAMALKRADSYLSDRFWSQALDEYKRAAAISPNDSRVLRGEAASHYMMDDFIEGDETADKLLTSC
jgi:hypothetical protein